MADEGLRGRLAKQGEDALGKLAQDLLENPLVNGALTRAFEAREKATQAQEAALGALNIPSAADVERLTRRLRSVSQRLEGIEDGVDRLDQRLAELKADDGNPLAAVDERLGAIEGQLAKLAADVAAGRARLRRRPGAGAARAGAARRRQAGDRRRASRAPRSPLRPEPGLGGERGEPRAAQLGLGALELLRADPRAVGDDVGHREHAPRRRRRGAPQTASSVAASISTASAPACAQPRARAGSGS